jgi:hypothetical protein
MRPTVSAVSISPVWPIPLDRHSKWLTEQQPLSHEVAIAVRQSRKCLRREFLLMRVSHVVGRTLGSHAYRIGGGGAWGFTSIRAESFLPS